MSNAAAGLGRRAVMNTAAVALGSNLAALGRLVAIALVARQSGSGVLAAYGVLIEVLRIAEGVLDFGASEVFVREIGRRPGESRRLLRVLAALKIVQLPVAAGVLAAGMAIFVVGGDSAAAGAEVQAGGAGVVSLAAFGVVLACRVPFRVSLSMHREVAAELLGVATLVALTATAARGAGLAGVMWAYAASRVVFGVACAGLGWRSAPLSVAGVSGRDLAWAARSCAVIGVSGLIVVVYQAMDLLLLDRVLVGEGAAEQTAAFIAGQRLGWPVLLGLSALGGTLYSVLAAAWPHDRAGFDGACQRGLDAVFVLAGFPVAALFCGGVFLVGLIEGDLGETGATVAWLTGLLCLAKAVGMTIGPALFIVNKQRLVFVMLVCGLVVKGAAVWWGATRFGAVGAAGASLAVETLCIAAPGVWLVSRHTGFRPAWGVPVRAMVCMAVVCGGVRAALAADTVLAVVVAPAAYGVLLVLTRTVRPAEIAGLLRRGSRGGVGPGDAL